MKRYVSEIILNSLALNAKASRLVNSDSSQRLWMPNDVEFHLYEEV
jgi:hypothetical protein